MAYLLSSPARQGTHRIVIKFLVAGSFGLHNHGKLVTLLTIASRENQAHSVGATGYSPNHNDIPDTYHYFRDWKALLLYIRRCETEHSLKSALRHHIFEELHNGRH